MHGITYPDPKLVVRPSTIDGAGMGLFVAENCMFRSGEVITEVEGYAIIVEEVEEMDSCERLNIFFCDGLYFKISTNHLRTGNGMGALVNGACDRFRPNVRCRTDAHNKLWIVADVSDEYPIIGPTELFLSYGSSWWKLFHLCRTAKKDVIDGEVATGLSVIGRRDVIKRGVMRLDEGTNPFHKRDHHDREDPDGDVGNYFF